MTGRMPLTSEDVLAERTEQLRKLFPEVFAEGRIAFDKLKEALGEGISTDLLPLFGAVGSLPSLDP
jgi:hypothetical protein